MHPLEYLRAVSRHPRIPAVEIAVEFARAVAEWSFDGPELVLASRRMLEHRPDAAPLWWVTSQLVTASSTVARAARLVDELAEDTVDPADASTLVLEVAAATSTELVIASPWADHAIDCAVTGREHLAVVRIGHHVRPEYLDRIVGGLEARGERPRRIACSEMQHRFDGSECPLATELLRTSPL